MSAPGRAVPKVLWLATVVVWVVLGGARVTRLPGPPETPVGERAAGIVPFAREVIPQDAAYLYVEPDASAPQSGLGPRLRYELYPRGYDDLAGSMDEEAVRRLARQNGARFIVVPDAGLYPAGSFLREARPWFRRVALDDSRYVLVLEP